MGWIWAKQLEFKGKIWVVAIDRRYAEHQGQTKISWKLEK